MTHYYLGIDGGQTSTTAILADETGVVMAMGTGSACDHITGPHGYERNREAIHSAIASTLSQTTIAAEAIVSVGMGLTSAPRELQATPIFERIVREVLQPEHIWIDHDVAGNLAGASAGAPGVVVIAGGGSISYGINKTGVEGKAGGLGYLMGDEGSGWWIGLQALQAAAKAVDGRGPETALLPFVLDHYRLATIRHIVGVIYGANFRRDEVSSIAGDVSQLAVTDAVAASIVDRAGVLLAEMAVATIRQIHTAGELVDVYPTGGVFRSERITASFSDQLEELWPETIVRQPQFAPVYGALFRAYQQVGLSITPALLSRLRETRK
ncbi:MAG: hypothetical protein M9950_06455 [Thermomicrobiales bacterium]|nr:hypothetical protein [Thermomicrobiales bacterium]